MRLVVTEKPSVARDIARVLGADKRRNGRIEGPGLCITWCVGHLCELEDPAHYQEAWRSWRLDTLPMLPDTFHTRARRGAADQWRVVRDLLRDRRFEQVVNACDAGREGELIFRWVYEQAGSKLPAVRLWVSSMTDAAITAAWSSLQPAAAYDRLADAARSRSESDWLVGLNATRAITLRGQEAGGNQLLSVGRVQTPTLAMVVARDLAIEAFVAEPFWQVKARFRHQPAQGEAVEWLGSWFREGGKATAKKSDRDEVSSAERLPSQAVADAVVAATVGQQGSIRSSGRKRKVERPPLLYDLTALQRRANQRYGLSAQRSLQLAQDLYEKHKLLTYPRTDARYLTPDQLPQLPGLVRAVGTVPVYAPFAQALLAAPIKPGKRVINAAEVGDHHAILPTDRPVGRVRLQPDEKRIYDLVARRLLAVLSADALFDITTILVDVPPAQPLPEGVEALVYRARGKLCVQAGWRAVDPPGRRGKDVELPAIEGGSLAEVVSVEAIEGKTRPPRRHNDASLLQSMETAGRTLSDAELARAMRQAGLGTPATRAAILQTLLDRGYIERKGKELWSTDKGRGLIDALPGTSLTSAELTGRWEAALSALAEGKGPGRAEFMRGVREHVVELIAAIKQAPPPQIAFEAPSGTVLGACPVCGKPVRERPAVYTCDADRACPFVVFKTMSKRAISERMVRDLLTKGRSREVKGFKSKKGNEFAAALVVQSDGRVGFDFAPREPKPQAPRPPGQCPKCGAALIRGRRAWGCSRWREGCDHVQGHG